MEIGRNEEKKSPATLIAAAIAAGVLIFAGVLFMVLVVNAVKPSRIDPVPPQVFTPPPVAPLVVNRTLPNTDTPSKPSVVEDTAPPANYLDQTPAAVYVAPRPAPAPATIIQPPSIFNHAGINAVSAGAVPAMTFSTDPVPLAAPVQVVTTDSDQLIAPIDMWNPFNPVGKWMKKGANGYHLIFRDDGICYQSEANEANIPAAYLPDASKWHTHFEGDTQIVTSGYDRFTVLDRNTILGDQRGVYVRVVKDKIP